MNSRAAPAADLSMGFCPQPRRHHHLRSEQRNTFVKGFYAPDRRRYYARLTADGIGMGLLDPLLSGSSPPRREAPRPI